MSTTNGTRALERVQWVPILLTASLTNRAAVVRYLLQEQPHTAWIVATGWRGSFSLEDTICAGAIACGFGLLVAGLRWRSRGSRDPVMRAWQRFCVRPARRGLACGSREGPLAFAERIAVDRPELANRRGKPRQLSRRSHKVRSI